ncbi:Nuclease-related domain protein [Pelotomaculum sp. FP]|uniref:NERD domain-containing protein n=1 Tax=Pelotomaculum sp. FP TaxID=261474 RepID=UPI001065D0E6|nr:NERD domain-containing protein [Pelotomaculum sp. FP]TEB12302.1 Nuclease-related domain protein [Pelotomaculum sp. FP]
MTFFDVLKQTISGRLINIKEPTFIRDECDAQAQIEKMEELKKTAPPEISKQIEQDIKILSYGISGENNVAYELKHSYMPILILRDLYLEYKDLTAQIDYVVIDTKFILIIECKTMTGDIEVTNTGDFIRLFKNSAGKIYKKEGIYSPIVQNERHLELIKHILCNDMTSMTEKKCKDLLHSIIVFANPKTIVNMKYAKADTKKLIIRCDQLISHMKNLHDSNKDGYWFPEEGMFRVAEVLAAHHKENVVDYTQKYGLTLQANHAEEVKKEQPQPVLTSPVSIENTAIYKELREYRLLKSREEGIKPYYIYNNNQLEQIISLMPETYGELIQIKGFADIKCNKYGDAIINIVKKFK